MALSPGPRRENWKGTEAMAREASSGPNGRHVLASGRVFMTPNEFLTKEKLITNTTVSGRHRFLLGRQIFWHAAGGFCSDVFHWKGGSWPKPGRSFRYVFVPKVAGFV